MATAPEFTRTLSHLNDRVDPWNDVRIRIAGSVEHRDCGHATRCWVWTGPRRADGYGTIRVGKKPYMAHRVSYQAHKGDIPQKRVLDHLCRNPSCVNPDHLEPVAIAVNNERGLGAALGRIRQLSKTHCPQGHPYEGENLRFNTYGARICITCTRRSGRESKRRARLKKSFGHAKLPTTFREYLSELNDREVLMLIDALSERLPEGAADELAQGLGAAFERIELTYANAAQYPFGNLHPGAWAEWRRERNAALAYRGVSL